MVKRLRATGQDVLFADLHMMLLDQSDAPAPPLLASLSEPEITPAPVLEEPAPVVIQEPTTSDWYGPLNDLLSRGSQAERPGGLAGLAAAREVTLSQFFTPNKVVQFMWSLVEPAMAAARNKIAVFDNSFGSGRMFQLARPDKHYLIGIEIDGECVEEVRAVVKLAGFEFQLEQGSMEEFRPDNFDLAMLNPPFSIQLDSPLVEPFQCGSFGKYGPKSSQKSQLYAVAQAL